ncbi:MAG: 5'-methylthioadenosine/S-adenosylhomocysteine nucleosidase [Candidatus Coproplasma sp.]
MIVFVIAMESEAKPVIENMNCIERSDRYGRSIVTGKICGQNCAVVVCGVGKVNAGAGAQYAIDCLGADKIINVGVAGALNNTMEVAKIYGVSHTVQYDFDLVQLNGTPMGTLNEYEEPFIPLSTVSIYPLKKVGTGDRFNDDIADFNLLTKELEADLRDMELGAIAHVCEHAKVKCYSFKAVSDIAGSSSTTEQFLQNLSKCVQAIKENTNKIFKAVSEN